MSWKDIFPKENRYFETKNGILYCGDCLEIMKKFPEKVFDTIIADPPYGTTICKWDIIIPFKDMWNSLKRIRKDKTPILIFGSEPFTAMLICSNLKEFREEIIWLKNKAGSGLQAKQKHIKVHEKIIVFSKTGNYTFNPQKWLVDKKKFFNSKKKLLKILK